MVTKGHPSNPFGDHMTSRQWNKGDPLPTGGDPRTSGREIVADNFAPGTLSEPRIMWVCPLPEWENELYMRCSEYAINLHVRNWAKECGFTHVWILAGPHATQTKFRLDGKPERAVDTFGNVLMEKRYEMDDPHITVRAGSSEHNCQVSGHLYVLLTKHGIPLLRRPTEAERKLAGSGDSRVDQLWPWIDAATRESLDSQWATLLETGLDPEAFHPARVGVKRPHDDGDYSSYYDIHNYACKRQQISLDYSTHRRTYIPKPATGVFLPKPLLAFLKRQEELGKMEIMDALDEDALDEQLGLLVQEILGKMEKDKMNAQTELSIQDALKDAQIEQAIQEELDAIG